MTRKDLLLKKEFLIIKGADLRQQLYYDLENSKQTIGFAEASWNSFLNNQRFAVIFNLVSWMIPNQKIKRSIWLSLRAFLAAQLISKYRLYHKSK